MRKEQEIYDISHYDYELPKENIAFKPLSQRDSSNLLLFDAKEGKIKDAKFDDISNHIELNSTIVRNNSKVIWARLNFTTETGAQIEIFLLEPADGSPMELMLQQKHKVVVKALVGKAKKWKQDELKVNRVILDK
ncbi:MAG: S-adenosylmethionine:tRNA ribosyltransferase-isomerase, partial [Flavobacteriales bacterium]|nr:S-adenosylmethionine:tRNA ribosyltransferase-isomerase [Flavobacteriales bacterium]